MADEAVAYCSQKKHRIIAIKKLLSENNIPIAGIKVSITKMRWTNPRGLRGPPVIEKTEESNDLIVPIEEFDEELNSLQTFELYVREYFEEMAIDLIDKCDASTFFGDCAFKSENYDEAFGVYLLLRKNKIPCDDVVTVISEDKPEEYLVIINPNDMETAADIIKQKYYPGEVLEKVPYTEQKNEFFDEPYPENKEKSFFWKIIPFIIVFCILCIRIENESIFEKIIKRITEIFF